MPCSEDTSCQRTLGERSFCKAGVCACIPHHHLTDNYCVKNRGNFRCLGVISHMHGENLSTKIVLSSRESSLFHIFLCLLFYFYVKVVQFLSQVYLLDFQDWMKTVTKTISVTGEKTRATRWAASQEFVVVKLGTDRTGIEDVKVQVH